ncbi:hypothetical protein VPH35_041047 [Triticum aestivum]
MPKSGSLVTAAASGRGRKGRGGRAGGRGGLFDATGGDRFLFFQRWISSLTSKIISWGSEHHRASTHLPMRQCLSSQIHVLLFKTIDIALIVIFLPVVSFALCGPAVCLTLSASRVGKQDYDIADRDASKANLKPALNLFYWVSTVHSIICVFYMMIECLADELLPEFTGTRHGFSPELLDGYLHQTKKMCVNNPASTMNWNLITYGVGLLDSNLPEDYASGGRVLAMLIDKDIPVPITWLLIRSPRQIIEKLIGTLAWTRIVEHLAGHLKLAQFPGALECISSLPDTSGHNNGDQEALHLPSVFGRRKPRKTRSLLDEILAGNPKKDKYGNMKIKEGVISSIVSLFLKLISKKYDTLENVGNLGHESTQSENGEGIDEDLVLPGLRILQNLAHDRHNCTLIYNTKDILSRVLAPIRPNTLVEDIRSNAAWTKVVDGSLKVVSPLMGSPGSTGQKMRRLIANNSNVVKNLEAILEMDMKSNCSIIELQVRAIEVLTQLALHHPASTSATKGREQFIEKALHIFLATDWMEDYLKYEKSKIDNPNARQRNTSPRPSIGTCMDNLVKKASIAWAKMMAEQASEARAKKKMKAAQEIASRRKEKAGEALAMLSSDSDVIKSFIACTEADAHRLTELLNSRIKTIKCKISAIDNVEIEINIGSRISATVILKHMSNYLKEPTLRKILAELLPVQVEESSTPQCWERLLPICCKSDIENPVDGGQYETIASPSNHIQQCGERRLQAELISLIVAILADSNFDFAAILVSPPPPKMVEDSMYATPACLAIQKLTCKMVIGFLQHGQNVELIDKHNIVGTLLDASKVMTRLESRMLFAGVSRGCHGVPLKPLSSVLAKNAEDLLEQKKQSQGVNSGPAGVPSP